MLKKHQSLLLITTLAAVMLLAAACGGNKATPTPAPSADDTAALPAPNLVQPESPVAVEQSVSRSPVSGPGAAAGARTFRIVPEQSEARYEVDEEFLGGASDAINKLAGLIETVGRTRAVKGDFQFNISGDQVTVAGGSIVVDLTTLASDDSRRDQRIRTQYLESSQYPLAEFAPTAIKNFPAGAAEGQDVPFQLLGDLTIRNITQPATFNVTAKLEGNALSGTARTTLLMTDFGFEPPNIANILKVADEFVVTIDFTAVQQ